jgi:hypothetical protein
MVRTMKKPTSPPATGITVLVACLVETLNESDPTFRERFLDRISGTYRTIRNDAGADCLDMLTRTSRMLERRKPTAPADEAVAERSLFAPGGMATAFFVPPHSVPEDC